MRQAQKPNRARGRGSRKGGGGNNVNRVYESAGPEGKVRGTPQQIVEKYLSLARDAQTSGDRVASENFLQHAEHYQRILLQATGAYDEKREQSSGDQDQDDDEAEWPRQSASGNGAEQPSGEDDTPRGQRGGRREERGGQRDEREAGRRPNGKAADHSDDTDDSGPGSLATIDTSDPSGPDLLVETKETQAPAPRRRRNTRAKRSDDGSSGEASSNEASSGADEGVAGAE